MGRKILGFLLAFIFGVFVFANFHQINADQCFCNKCSSGSNCQKYPGGYCDLEGLFGCSYSSVCCYPPTSTPAPTNTPKPTPGYPPTSTPAPTNTPKSLATPTLTPKPTPGGDICYPSPPLCGTGTNYCMKINCKCDCNGKNCQKPNCSSVCLYRYEDGKYHCHNTGDDAEVGCKGPTSSNWGQWNCLSGEDKCGACKNQGYTCAVRFCINPPNSNEYDITCGCPLVSLTPTTQITFYNDITSYPTIPPTNQQPNFTPTPTLTPTPSIRPWIKLKNTSFYSNKTLNITIPSSPVAYDSDDDNSSNFIIASPNSDPGLVSASFINLAYGQPSVKGWKTTKAQNNIQMSYSSLFSYLKTRTIIKTLSSIDDIVNSNLDKQILILNTEITINDTNKNIFNNRSLVIMVNDNLNISVNGSFTPSNANLVFIIKNSLNFSPNTIQANAIFIANSINTGATSNQGLKIIGNLIAQNNFVNDRKWSNVLKPSVFVVFDQNQYLSLLPYFSTTSYEWRQEQ